MAPEIQCSEVMHFSGINYLTDEYILSNITFTDLSQGEITKEIIGNIYDGCINSFMVTVIAKDVSLNTSSKDILIVIDEPQGTLFEYKNIIYKVNDNTPISISEYRNRIILNPNYDLSLVNCNVVYSSYNPTYLEGEFDLVLEILLLINTFDEATIQRTKPYYKYYTLNYKIILSSQVEPNVKFNETKLYTHKKLKTLDIQSYLVDQLTKFYGSNEFNLTLTQNGYKGKEEQKGEYYVYYHYYYNKQEYSSRLLIINNYQEKYIVSNIILSITITLALLSNLLYFKFNSTNNKLLFNLNIKS
jgi:hypothetical protein